MLNVHLLGGSSLSVDGVVVKSDLGPAGRLLACYLLEFVGRVHRRERLADLFWGDTDPDKARAALNTAIWRFRKILDLGAKGMARLLTTIGNDVILEPSPCIHVDTHQIQQAYTLVAKQPNGGVLTARDEQEINAAVECYTGPFLEGYDNDWVLQERERLHCLFVRTTFELMRAAARRGEYERALDCGRRILATDPLRENTQRDVLLLLVLNGQRAEAVRAYRRLKELLRTELNIDPMPETKRLSSDIASGEIFAHIHEYAQAQFGLQGV